MTENIETTGSNLQGAGDIVVRPNTFLTYAARAVSLLMHPFLMQTYAVLLLLWGNTVISLTPAKTKWYLMTIVAANTFVMPALSIAIMRVVGFLKDMSLTDRRARLLPMIITAACYAFGAYLVSGFLITFLIRKFLLAGVACMIFAFILTLFWKVSIYMAAVGGVLAMLLIIMTTGLGDMTVPITVLVLMGGVLASARLYLGHHNPAQVLVGFLGGFVSAMSVMLLVR